MPGPELTSAEFTPDGRHLVLLQTDSPLLRFIDLPALRAQLGRLGLDW
jgi:hypothetical protein